jgi:hypothetical protein
MRNSMRQMLEIGIGPFALPGALADASCSCGAHRLGGATLLWLESSELGFTLEDTTWKTPA